MAKVRKDNKGRNLRPGETQRADGSYMYVYKLGTKKKYLYDSDLASLRVKEKQINKDKVLREKAPETHRKEGEKLKLTGEKVAHEGAFTPGNGWQEVRFTTPVKGRYFCLEALSPQANDNIAAIAEFDVLGADGKPVSREHWKIRYADSEETRSGNRTADKIFDLQESTFWMTVDNVAYPHQLVIDLSKVETVTGFRYLPRAEKNYPGMIKEYRVYVKPADFKY